MNLMHDDIKSFCLHSFKQLKLLFNIFPFFFDIDLIDNILSMLLDKLSPLGLFLLKDLLCVHFNQINKVAFNFINNLVDSFGIADRLLFAVLASLYLRPQVGV